MALLRASRRTLRRGIDFQDPLDREACHLARPDGVGDVQGCEVPRIDDQVGSARGRLITHEDADQSDGPGDPAASAVGGMAGEADVRFAGWDVRVDQVAVDVERVGGVWSVDADADRPDAEALEFRKVVLNTP